MRFGRVVHGVKGDGGIARSKAIRDVCTGEGRGRGQVKVKSKVGRKGNAVRRLSQLLEISAIRIRTQSDKLRYIANLLHSFNSHRITSHVPLFHTPFVSVLDNTGVQGELNAHLQRYCPDAGPAQPMAKNACCAASSFAFCLLFPTPSPFAIPLTGGQDISKQTLSCTLSAVFTNALYHPSQRVSRPRLTRIPIDL